MPGFVLLWLLAASSLQMGWAKQRFDEEPSPIEVDPGKRAMLVCRVQNIAGMCLWSRDGGFVGVFSGKYEYQSTPSDGDCSLRISDASMELDDANWQCQVTAATPTEKTLISRTVHVTVRNPPLPPFIEHSPGNQHNPIRMSNNDPIGTTADAELPLSCISQQGNPPAILRWFLGNDEITDKAHQRNDSDPDKPKTWRAKSSLNYTFQKEHNGKSLKCVAYHPLSTLEVVVILNVRYKPTVRFAEKPPKDVEENQILRIGCISDANPRATILWNTPQGVKTKEVLEFKPVSRSDSGPYSCRASNDVGESPALEVNLDVRYPPKILHVEPQSRKITAEVHENIKFSCRAEGNPSPRYSWLQSVDKQPNGWQHRGSESVFNIQNATYGFQGRYICEVSNTINQKEFKDKSFEIELDIMGPPQVLKRGNENGNTVFEKDEDATISVVFCSDPKPTEMYWEWGSNKLELGDTKARYSASPLLKDELPEDCFQARLTIQQVVSSDARSYTLNVKNNKGHFVQSVELKVQEPVTMSAVIGIVVSCIIVLVIVVVVVYYLLRKEKCMFLRSKGFKPDASENSSRRLSEELTNGYPQKDRAIPPDALYTDVQESPSSSPSHSQKRGDTSIVYADLDFAALQAKGQGSKTRSPPDHGRGNVEYAEIQFKPSSQRVDV